MDFIYSFLQRWQAFLIIALVALGAYAAGLSGEFVWDDSMVISSNTFVHDWNNFPLIFTRQYLTSPEQLPLIGQQMIGAGEASYRPVVTATYFLDYAVWGLNPFGFRLTNLILHILCCWMVYVFLRFWIKNRSAVLWAALIFAVHPVQAEAVILPSMREDLLAALFYLATLILYVNHFYQGRDKKNAGIYGLMLMIYALGLFSKEMAVTLPLMLWIVDGFLRKEPFAWNFFLRRRYWGFYALTGVYLFIWKCVMGRPEGFSAVYPGGSFYTNVLNMLKVAGIYFNWIVAAPWTVHPTLTTGADFIVRSFWSPQVASSLVMLLVVALAVLRLRRRIPPAGFAVLWIIVTLLPVMNIIPLQNIYASRFLYLPMAGFVTLFGLILENLLSGKPLIRMNADFWKLCAGVLVLFYAVLTCGQHFRWKDEPAFRMSVVRDNPLHLSSRIGLAHVYRNQIRDPRLAIEQLLIARAIDPDYLMNSMDLVGEYLKTGEVDAAVQTLQQALQRDPGDIGLRDMLCAVQGNAGRLKQAAACYDQILRRDPLFWKAYRDLYVSCTLMGDQRRALMVVLRLLDHLAQR